jgi:predicted nucleic acid-binding protein
MRFFDTNILVYARTNHEKAVAARSEIVAGGWISVQVLSEFTSVMRYKLRHSWDYIDSSLYAINDAVRGVVSLTPEIQSAAYRLAKFDGINIYDGLIVAAAKAARCTELVTEDFQHGRRFGDLTIRNPFL